MAATCEHCRFCTRHFIMFYVAFFVLSHLLASAARASHEVICSIIYAYISDPFLT